MVHQVWNPQLYMATKSHLAKRENLNAENAVASKISETSFVSSPTFCFKFVKLP